MENLITPESLVQIEENVFEIPQNFRPDMRVPARVFASKKMLDDISDDKSLWQLANVATLPGIQRYAYAMPDVHQGYGFPIGGVAAMALDEGGVISPGGIGYDINCGVRLHASSLLFDDIKKQLPDLATALYNKVPSGMGHGGNIRLNKQEMDIVLRDGAKHMVALGYGTANDLVMCEENGCMEAARPDFISDSAKKRGNDQLGTLGSGNHFLEVQKVDEIFDQKAADAFGLKKDQITVMVHCGSRGLGHQVCSDYVSLLMNKASQWGYTLPDRELICAPFESEEGQRYFAAMAAAANFAWANRQMITHWIREVWQSLFGNSEHMRLVYDLSHNMGKRETHTIDGKKKSVIIHRKGATRAFGPGHPDIPDSYKHVGQPVLIPGTMGTASYVLIGTQEGMDVAFGSSCHGAGRRLSRQKSKQMIRGGALRRELEARGIHIRSQSDRELAEEAPKAYKDVEEVVNVVHSVGLAHKVARLVPLAVIKG